MMHLRHSSVYSTPRPAGRLVQFRPTSVPRTKPASSLWNRTSADTFSLRPNSGRRSKSLDPRPKTAPHRKADKSVHFAYYTDREQQTEQQQSQQAEQDSENQHLIYRKPSAIYRYNSAQFLNSLRNFRRTAVSVHQSELSRHYKMSKEIMDSFVRLKSDQLDNLFGLSNNKSPVTQPVNGFAETHHNSQTSPTMNNTSANHSSLPSTNGISTEDNMEDSFPKKSTKITSTPVAPLYRKKNHQVRPKSASIHSRRAKLGANSATSKSTSRLNTKADSEHHSEVHSDDEQLKMNGNHEHGEDEYDEDGEVEMPLFHRSLDKISSIANWERQIRYELEIEKELQRRELDRQKEKIHSDQRKLEEWDKHLRIELDARERKIRLNEEELRSRYDEFSQKSSDLMRREQMINEIVTERIKSEMKFEIEKLRKKFNELELDKNNLNKKEERVKEVEARLHEQVKIVKEKIDSKRLSDVEHAKLKKELEIVTKENEVLKEKVDSMEDYQVLKYENRAMKNELQILKEGIDSKNQELERERDRWEKEQRASDQKIFALRGELRKAEQELVIQKQKAQGDLDEMSSKYEAVNGQLKRQQTFIKEHLAKLNSDFSSAAQSLNAHTKPLHGSFGSVSGTLPVHHMRHHSSTHHLRMNRSAPHTSSRYEHQRSISMDGHDYMSGRGKGWSSLTHRSPARGCRLCADDDSCELDHDVIDEDEHYITVNSNGAFHDIEEEEGSRKESSASQQEKETTGQFKRDTLQNGEHQPPAPNGDTSANKPNDDEVVQKIVDKIYEKMSHQVKTLTASSPQKEQNGSLLMSRLLASISEKELTPISPQNNKSSANSNRNSIMNDLIATKRQTIQDTFPGVESPIKPIHQESERKLSQSLKSMLTLNDNDDNDFDGDTNDIPSHYEQQSGSKSMHHKSLYEELLASDIAAGPSSSSPTGQLHNRQSSNGVPSSSDININNSPNRFHLSTIANSQSAIHNDDNNNHVLSKKALEEELLTTSRAQTAPKGPRDSATASRSNSEGDSRSDSKSESFEIDW